MPGNNQSLDTMPDLRDLPNIGKKLEEHDLVSG